MPYQLRRSAVFDKDCSFLVSQFPKSKTKIEQAPKDVLLNPGAGAGYPGFGSTLEIRKVRVGLKEYRLGKSHGLRLIYLVQKEKKAIVPIAYYKKGRFKKEAEVIALVRKNLAAILAELEAGH